MVIAMYATGRNKLVNFNDSNSFTKKTEHT